MVDVTSGISLNTFVHLLKRPDLKLTMCYMEKSSLERFRIVCFFLQCQLPTWALWALKLQSVTFISYSGFKPLSPAWETTTPQPRGLGDERYCAYKLQAVQPVGVVPNTRVWITHWRRETTPNHCRCAASYTVPQHTVWLKYLFTGLEL